MDPEGDHTHSSFSPHPSSFSPHLSSFSFHPSFSSSSFHPPLLPSHLFLSHFSPHPTLLILPSSSLHSSFHLIICLTSFLSQPFFIPLTASFFTLFQPYSFIFSAILSYFSSFHIIFFNSFFIKFFFIPYSLHHSFIPHSSFIIHPFTIYRFTTHPIFTTHSSITHPSNNPPFMLPPDCFLQRQTRGCTAIASCGPVTCTKPLTAASSAPPTTSISTTQTSKPEL